MSAQSSSDVETKILLQLLEDRKVLPIEDASPILGLTPGSQQIADSLRLSLLKGFKAVNDIHVAAQENDKKSLRKAITRLFNKNNPNTKAVQAIAMQEAFAYMHRELTNLLTATGNNKLNFNDEVIDQKVAEIINKGTEKLPKGTIHRDLKIHMDIFQAQAKQYLTIKAPSTRQQNR